MGPDRISSSSATLCIFTRYQIEFWQFFNFCLSFLGIPGMTTIAMVVAWEAWAAWACQAWALESQVTITYCSVADPGCWIWIFSIPDTNFFHPISASKNLSILTQKMVSILSEIRSGLFIPDPDPDLLPIPDPWSRIQGSKRRRIPDPQYWHTVHRLKCWWKFLTNMKATRVDTNRHICVRHF